MHLRSLDGCRLAIGAYPSFKYNARGGGGVATSFPTEEANITHLRFNPKTFSIPSLTWRNTKFLSLPLPPGLKIEMSMNQLEGTMNSLSGEILLKFESRFFFSISSIFKFPYLIVKTSLKTGKVKGNIHEEEGLILQSDGRTKLVGIALIPPTGNKALDIFLGLPTEALAVLECEIK